MVKKGDFLKVKTKTFQDVFGICYYRVLETGLPSPEKDRDENDGVRVIMLGGTGPAAREDLVIRDSQWRIGLDISAGITQMISEKEVKQFLKQIDDGSGITSLD